MTKLAAVLAGATLTLFTTVTEAAADPDPAGSTSPGVSAIPSASPSTRPTGSPSPSLSPSASPTSPIPSPSNHGETTAAGELTVTVTQDCFTFDIEAAIVNETDGAVTVGVTNLGGPILRQVTVEAGGTGGLVLLAPNGDFRLEYRRLDTGEIVATFTNDDSACGPEDQSIRVVSGTPYTISIPCFVDAEVSDPLNGTARVDPQMPNGKIIYTSDAGYVGQDQFGYFCQSEKIFGTIFITVVPRPASPPAQPSLPATGSMIKGQVAVGVGLLFAGAVILVLARRRRA